LESGSSGAGMRRKISQCYTSGIETWRIGSMIEAYSSGIFIC